MNKDIDFFVALSILLGALTIWLANPDKGKLQKLVYWLITPVLIGILMSIGTGSAVLGAGIAVMYYGFIAAGYFRFRT
ncbi:hypothetical protein [Mycobacteroides immunogenum]|uniref:Uncharacterized protein n=1 Tax=Mycobacteroides immunogenum TaxID=83262 RepID=A0ABR5LKJ7_9MYCO|nr:hypothetical protein [Mycobacteroides immunogenum]KPG26215.1 hypothetical protein AN912_25540 [Mycobacteroides immunogenum]KPG26289.1 hypothetical protein AN913_21225 [Mycobacteroides immunogenum]KPG31840.1 hypothetical protein AN914_26085 [Mycobacteroides immunogenum]KPG39683.1 hypothetical protein AN915_26465 [Mycobacteroides immunogenum]KPG57310.1 hypothetical protein AN918_26610 [Mycobacteroides immunogenum]